MYKAAIVIPVWNGFRGEPDSTWFADSIHSALINNCAVTIVDDGSDDGTTEWLHSHDFVDDSVKVIYCDENRGVAAAFNTGFRESAAEYLVTQGSDDVSYALRVDKQAAYLDAHPDIAMVGCFYDVIEKDGRLIERVEDVDTEPEEIKLTLLCGKCHIGSPMIRKSVWEELGGFDETNFARTSEDYDFFLRVAENYKIGVVPEVLYAYRHVPLQLTKTNFMPNYFKALDASRQRRRNAGRSPNFR